MNVNATMQRLCTWTAPACTVIFFLGFAISGYLVPSPPSATAEETARFYLENTSAIRLGLVIMCFAGPLWIIWSAAMSVQMMRIEGRWAPLALSNLGLGACACIEFIMPVYFWLTASYRNRSPEIQQTLHDMGWLPFDGFVWTIIFQNILIGIAVVMDKRSRPLFPRWYGYVSFWVALLYVPAGFNVFFKTGPIAWNGPISWWLLLAAIFGWLMLTTYLLLVAIKRQELEAAARNATDVDDEADLRDRIASVEVRLDELGSVRR
jgi:hypothetical protein